MNILIANNRNITRGEVSLLAARLSTKHKVTVAYMEQDASFKGLAFSYENAPVHVNQVSGHSAEGVAVFEFGSYPADMISIMLGEIMRHDPPDLVICGISNGVNMGPDIYSSSNVGMAIESTFFGIPAIVIATEYNQGGNSITHLEPVIKFVEKNLDKFANLELPAHTFLNINVPRVEKYKDIKGIKFTHMGKSNMKLEYIERTCPKGRKYYWSKIASQENMDKGGEDDKTWFDQGYISISPISYDPTDLEGIKSMRNLAREAK
ncbi:MAG: hypothetical protein FWE16_00655 [Firmicutes bacterium]|nr:hypothetical protein [Bacillota bacterium]